METLVKFKYITFYNSILSTLLFVRLKNTRFSKILLFSIYLYNSLSELKRLRSVYFLIRRSVFMSVMYILFKRRISAKLEIRIKELRSTILNLDSNHFFYQYKDLVLSRVCKPFFTKKKSSRKRKPLKVSVYALFYSLSRIVKYKCPYTSNPSNPYFHWQVTFFFQMSYNIGLDEFRRFYSSFKKVHKSVSNDINSFFFILENKLDIFLFRFCMLSKSAVHNCCNSNLIYINGNRIVDSNQILSRGDVLELYNSSSIINNLLEQRWLLFFFNIYTLNNVYFRKLVFPIKRIVLCVIFDNLSSFKDSNKYTLVRHLYYPTFADISRITYYKPENLLMINVMFSIWNFNIDCLNGSVYFTSYYYGFCCITHNVAEAISLDQLLHYSSSLTNMLYHLYNIKQPLYYHKYENVSNRTYPVVWSDVICNLRNLLSNRFLLLKYLITFKDQHTFLTTLLFRVNKVFKQYRIKLSRVILLAKKNQTFCNRLLVHRNIVSDYMNKVKDYRNSKWDRPLLYQLKWFSNRLIRCLKRSYVSYFHILHSRFLTAYRYKDKYMLDHLKDYTKASVVFDYKGMIWSFFLSSITITSSDVGCLYWSTGKSTCVLVYGLITFGKHITSTLMLNKSLSLNTLERSFRYDFNL